MSVQEAVSCALVKPFTYFSRYKYPQRPYISNVRVHQVYLFVQLFNVKAHIKIYKSLAYKCNLQFFKLVWISLTYSENSKGPGIEHESMKYTTSH